LLTPLRTEYKSSKRTKKCRYFDSKPRGIKQRKSWNNTGRTHWSL